jgi:hypothetical protein
MEQRTIPVKNPSRDVTRAVTRMTGLSYDELILEMLLQFDMEELQLQEMSHEERVQRIIAEQEIPPVLLEDVEIDVDESRSLATT